MASPLTSQGNPAASGFNSTQLAGRDAGFRYDNPNVDDDTALAAAKELGVSNAVAQDAAAIEIQFDRLAAGEADFNRDYTVPGWVAQKGMDANHRQGVESVLDRMGEMWGNSELTEVAKDMYADGIETQQFAKQGGLQPYGQTKGEVGTWINE